MLAEHLKDVAIDIEPLPDEQTCRDAGVEDPADLLGLYHGIPLTERSVTDSGELPAHIVIYQRNVEDVCETVEDVVAEVRITVLHEIGHHLGLDEKDLEALGYD